MKDFLYSKGISDVIIKDFQLEVQPFITYFPIFDHENKLLYKKYRKKGENEMMPLGSTSTLYGINKINKKTVLLVEGSTDMLAMQSIGVSAITSTTGVMSFKQLWFDHPALVNKELVVCFDNDEAGHKGMLRMWRMKPELRFVFIPETEPIKSDLSDFIVKYKEDKTKELLNTAKVITKGFTSHLGIEFKDEEKQFEVANYNNSFDLDSRDEDRVSRAKSIPIPEIQGLGLNWKGKSAVCPWHTDKDPSLMWNPKGNYVKCFVCGESGDSIEIVRKINNLSFFGALEYLVGPAPDPPKPNWKKYYERRNEK